MLFAMASNNSNNNATNHHNQNNNDLQHNNPSNRCCRSARVLGCHVITAVKLMAVFESITVVILIGYFLFGFYRPVEQTTEGYQKGFASSASRTWYVGVAVLVALFLTVFLIGLYKQSVRMVYGYGFALVLQICVCLFIIVDIVLAAKNRPLMTAVGVTSAAMFVVVKTFFCYLIYRCGKYMQERGSGQIGPTSGGNSAAATVVEGGVSHAAIITSTVLQNDRFVSADKDTLPVKKDISASEHGVLMQPYRLLPPINLNNRNFNDNDNKNSDAKLKL